MAFFTINKELCAKDKICAQLCPAAIIELDNDGYPFISDEKSASCIKCGHCVAFCPHDACEVASITDTKSIDKALMPSAEQTDTLLLSRRSIRRYKKEGLPRHELEKLIHLASQVSSASNSRLIRWIVLEKRSQLDKVIELMIDYFRAGLKSAEPGSRHAAVIQRILGAHEAGIDVIFRTAPQLIIAAAPMQYDWKIEDASIALTYLEIAAHGHGAGACWAGFFSTVARQYQPLKQYLGISEDEHVCGAQMIGYPVYGLSKRVPLRDGMPVVFLED